MKRNLASMICGQVSTPACVRKSIFRLSIVTLLFASVFLTGCQFPGPRKFDPRKPYAGAAALQPITVTNQLSPALLKAPDKPFTLGPGDVIEVEVLDDLASRVLLTVGPDGKIYFNLLPGLDVWGLTLAQTKDLLERELSKYVRERPQIAVTLRGVESKRIWLMGRFLAPGVYPMTNSMTLLEAIYTAGGPLTLSASPEFSRDAATYNSDDTLADLRHSFVLRNGQIVPVDFQRLFSGDLTQNIYLEPDDFVYLPPRNNQRIYVMGAVVLPQKEAYVRNMTVSMAIANAGGLVKYSYRGQVAVVRGSLNRPEIALVDIEDIMRGKATDVLLEPGDIVYVPYQPYRLLSRYLDVITSTFVSATAINEGSRAVLQNAPPTQGILIPFGSTITVTPTAGGR